MADPSFKPTPHKKVSGVKAKAKIDVDSLVDAREHVLYCGVTMTGKTTLAREHAQILVDAKYEVIVYDPVMTETANGGWPDGVRIIHEPDELMEQLDDWKGNGGDPEHPTFLFVDEAPDIFNHSNTASHLIARRIRHDEIYLRLIAQRPNMIHPSARTQCSYVYMLRLSNQDSRIICGDMGHGSEVYQIPLDKGDCILLTSGSSQIEQFNVFELIGVDPDKPKEPSK